MEGKEWLHSLMLACVEAHLCQCCITLKMPEALNGMHSMAYPPLPSLWKVPSCIHLCRGRRMRVIRCKQTWALQRHERDQARNDLTGASCIIRASQA